MAKTSKRGRPRVRKETARISVSCSPEEKDAIKDLAFTHTGGNVSELILRELADLIETQDLQR